MYSNIHDHKAALQKSMPEALMNELKQGNKNPWDDMRINLERVKKKVKRKTILLWVMLNLDNYSLGVMQVQTESDE